MTKKNADVDSVDPVARKPMATKATLSPLRPLLPYALRYKRTIVFAFVALLMTRSRLSPCRSPCAG